MSKEFLTYTLSRKQISENPHLLNRIKDEIARQQIKVVDIKHRQEELVIVYRKLS